MLGVKYWESIVVIYSNLPTSPTVGLPHAVGLHTAAQLELFWVNYMHELLAVWCVSAMHNFHHFNHLKKRLKLRGIYTLK